MSVAIIVDTFPRWSERFIARELNELQRRGLEFTIYCLRAGDVDCEADPEFSGLIHRRVVLPSCFLPSFARELGMDAAAKERMRLVEQELGITAFRQIGCADSLTKLIREHRHEIVYAHFASLPSTLGWLAAEALKLPLLISCHARDVFVDAQIIRTKIDSARKVFTCNRTAARRLNDIWFGEKDFHKLELMAHGLPLEQYPYCAGRERSPNGKSLRLLAAGRFVPKKGFNDLIDALGLPELSDVDISLTILGDGSERKSMTKRIERLGLTSRISMPGVVGEPEMKRYFQDADVFVMPSVEMADHDCDGLPNVLLEAAALGVPLIGTNAGSLSDLLSVDTGSVVERVSSTTGVSRFARDLALAIRDVLMNPEGALKRAKAARAVVEERFDIRKNIEPLFKELSIP